MQAQPLLAVKFRVGEMSRLIIKDIRNRTVEGDGKLISFEIIPHEGASTECEVELTLLGKIVLAFQDIYMKANRLGHN